MGREEDEAKTATGSEIRKVTSSRGRVERAEENCEVIKFDQVNLLFKHEYA